MELEAGYPRILIISSLDSALYDEKGALPSIQTAVKVSIVRAGRRSD
jgi:hypothetical protein